MARYVDQIMHCEERKVENPNYVNEVKARTVCAILKMLCGQMPDGFAGRLAQLRLDDLKYIERALHAL